MLLILLNTLWLHTRLDSVAILSAAPSVFWSLSTSFNNNAGGKFFSPLPQQTLTPSPNLFGEFEKYIYHVFAIRNAPGCFLFVSIILIFSFLLDRSFFSWSEIISFCSSSFRTFKNLFLKFPSVYLILTSKKSGDYPPKWCQNLSMLIIILTSYMLLLLSICSFIFIFFIL